MNYVVELRPLPNWPTTPEQRLKAFLKRALRNYGLRCTSVAPVKERETRPKGGRENV
jgi:hypothetical protein